MWLPLQRPHARKVPSSELTHLASGLKKNQENGGIYKPYLGPANLKILLGKHQKEQSNTYYLCC